MLFKNWVLKQVEHPEQTASAVKVQFDDAGRRVGHKVQLLQLRSEEEDGVRLSNVEFSVQAVRAVHCRSVVAVGAAVWYWLPVQFVIEAQTAVDVAVAIET